MIIYMVFTLKLRAAILWPQLHIYFKIEKNIRHNKGETRPLLRISLGVRPLWQVPPLQSYSHLEV